MCGGYFLLHDFALADNFLLRSGMPCVARTFLSCHVGTSDRLSGCLFGVQRYSFFAISSTRVGEKRNFAAGLRNFLRFPAPY